MRAARRHGLLLALLAGSARAWGWQAGAGELEVKAGYELESLGEMTQASVTKVSGARVLARFDGLLLDSGPPSSAPRFHASFATALLSLDPWVSLSAQGLPRRPTCPPSPRRFGRSW